MPIHPNASKEIDRYIAGTPAFAQPICRKLRTLIHKADAGIVEDWKWGPNFNKQGMICGFGAFKAHVTLAFFKGSLLKDSKKILFACSESNVHNRSIKFTDAKQIDETALIAYVKEAAKLNELGVKPAPRRAPIKMPPDLKKGLAAKAKARQYFEGLTPGYQREYIEWVVQAKRPETREARITTTIKQCGEGKTLHYKYK